MMNKIALYCEFDYKKNILSDVSYELISKANELKNEALKLKNEQWEVEAVAIGTFLDEDSIKKAYAAGANRVVLVKNDNFASFNALVFARAFVEYFRQNEPRVVLFPATHSGRAVAPRITTSLDTGLVADCTGVEFILKDGNLKLAPTRPTFGAELMATILSKKSPECATIRPKTFKAEFDFSRNGEFVEFYSFQERDFKIKLLKNLIDDKENIVDFANAKIVLAAGFGLLNGKDSKYVEKLKKLCKLTGAKFASSRKLVDFNITDHSTQIGQTGSSTEAQLYIAFGISGAIQHICGMKNSKTIIAINTDENAPIFQYSDYKIVKDACVVIDELLELLEGK